jgi:hypothetical protein
VYIHSYFAKPCACIATLLNNHCGQCTYVATLLTTVLALATLLNNHCAQVYIHSYFANPCACIATLPNNHCAQCSYICSYFAKRPLLLNVVVLLHGSWKRKAVGMTWTGFTWHRTRKYGGLLWLRYWTFGFRTNRLEKDSVIWPDLHQGSDVVIVQVATSLSNAAVSKILCTMWAS